VANLFIGQRSWKYILLATTFGVVTIVIIFFILSPVVGIIPMFLVTLVPFMGMCFQIHWVWYHLRPVQREIEALRSEEQDGKRGDIE